jgi:hypothetical protein
MRYSIQGDETDEEVVRNTKARAIEKLTQKEPAHTLDIAIEIGHAHFYLRASGAAARSCRQNRRIPSLRLLPLLEEV